MTAGRHKRSLGSEGGSPGGAAASRPHGLETHTLNGSPGRDERGLGCGACVPTSSPSRDKRGRPALCPWTSADGTGRYRLISTSSASLLESTEVSPAEGSLVPGTEAGTAARPEPLCKHAGRARAEEALARGPVAAL